MEQSGEYAIPAPRRVVWAALNDPETLRLCISGCERLERTGANDFIAKVKAKIGPVSAKFDGAVTLADLRPPESYRLRVEAKGGAAGFGKGEAAVTLSETADGGTLLRYSANAIVGGKLAQIGSRLIDAAVRKMADAFFAALSERTAAANAATAAGDAATAMAEAAMAREAPRPAAAALGGARKLAFAGALGLLATAIVVIFAGAGD